METIRKQNASREDIANLATSINDLYAQGFALTINGREVYNESPELINTADACGNGTLRVQVRQVKHTSRSTTLYVKVGTDVAVVVQKVA